MGTKPRVIFREEGQDEIVPRKHGLNRVKNDTGVQATHSNPTDHQLVKKRKLRPSYIKSEVEHTLQNPSKAEIASSHRQIQEGVQEGIKEVAKEDALAHEKAKKALESLLERREIELLKIKSVFPFDMFPNTIAIDSLTVSFIEKSFFATEHVTTINFKDILDVEVQTAWFLASLSLTFMPKAEGQGMLRPTTLTMPNLKRKDAIKAKNILKGVLFVRREGVDITKISERELNELMVEFGERGVQV